jgi:hypothetical protein
LVLEEEGAIDTGNADELAVADREDIPKRLPDSYGRRDASRLGDEGGLVVTVRVSISGAVLRERQAY